MTIKCIAFDCFGTVFDMADIPREEIAAYVAHVRKNDFTPYRFPEGWYTLPSFTDVRLGFDLLREQGYRLIALSNGSKYLLTQVARVGGYGFDHVVDLAAHRIYKPHIDAYRTVEKDTGYTPAETLMVTANPTFGDIEGAAAIGMQSQVIRQPGCPQTIVELAEMLGKP